MPRAKTTHTGRGCGPNGPLPAHNRDAERCVLSAAMQFPELLPAVRQIVVAEHFHFDAHQKVFRAVCELAADGRPIDLVLLAETLKKRGHLDDVGGAGYLAELRDAVPTGAAAEYHAKLVLSCFIRRSVVHTANEVLRDAAAPTGPDEELAVRAEHRFRMLADVARGAGGAKPAAKIRAVSNYVPFPAHVLPAQLQHLILAGADAIGCDHTFVALPALTTLSAAVGATRRVEIKRGWQEPPFISTAIVAPSGAKKSPPFKLAAEDPAEDINDRLDCEFREEWQRHEAAEDQWRARRPGDRGPRPQPPAGRRFSFSNITLEALLGKLAENPRGALIHRDELDGWLKSFTRYAGRGSSDLPDWLSLFNAATVNNSRKTGDRKDVRVRGVGVAVTGTIQPSVLREAMSPEFMGAGLFARLAIAMPPPVSRVWRDAEVEESVTRDYGRLVSELFELDFAGANENGRRLPVVVALSEGARRRFVDFYNRNGQAIDLAEGNEAAARSKLEGYGARLALVFHCCAGGGGAVDEGTMQDGIAVAEWFINEALRVYDLFRGTADEADLRDLFEKVRAFADKKGGAVTANDLHKSNRSRWPSAESAELALESLVCAGLGTWAPRSPRAAGRPTRSFMPRNLDPGSPEYPETG